MLEHIQSQLRKLRRRPWLWRKARRGKLRRVSEPALVEFEERHGFQLPKGFRSFICSVDHRGWGPGYGLMSMDDWTPIDSDMPPARFLQSPCPLRPEWRTASTDAFDLDDHLEQNREPTAGAIHIATHGCAFDMLLVISGPMRGRVVAVDLDFNSAPFFPPETSFLAWYRRWLDEVLGGWDLTWFGFHRGGNVEELAEVLASGTTAIDRADAARSLARAPKLDEASKTQLRLALKDPDPGVRIEAARTCAHRRVRVDGPVGPDLFADEGQ